MICNNPNLDLINMNAYIKFREILPIGSQEIKRKQNFSINQGPLCSGTNLQKMTCNNPKLDLARMNAYIKFGEILPIDSLDFEPKRNFGINKGP